MIAEAKMYVILALLLAAAVGEGVLCYHFYLAGERKVDAQDYSALQKHDKATAEQAAKDKADAQDIIDELRGQLRDALAPQPQPARSIRVCDAHSGNTGRPAGAAPSGAQPGEPARPADDSALLVGDQPGPDVAADVQALADAGVILAIYRARLAEWAERQSTPLKGTN